ncbi:MAG: LemA family protein [Tissierellia bacterium]|nr:LemA family protein [Tissierellia bacterium]
MYILLILLAIIIIYAISVYNNLVSQREFIRNAMSNIAAQIESRWDAVKNLIDATKSYSEYESNTLKAITDKRTSISENSSAREVEEDDQLFNRALTNIKAVAENYPDLKSNTLYIKTMDSVNEYENNVRMSRMVYNDTVTKLNRLILQFPSSIVAGIFGFKQEEYFKQSQEKSEMPSW